MTTDCPFCSPAPSDIVVQNALCYARYDRYPVSTGHLLILPLRHVADFLVLTPEEHSAALELLRQAKARLDAEHHPQGYNVGINAGAPAGQTIAHAHIHLIPRYTGDVPDPRGGVRFVIPIRAAYWHDAGEESQAAK